MQMLAGKNVLGIAQEQLESYCGWGGKDKITRVMPPFSPPPPGSSPRKEKRQKHEVTFRSFGRSSRWRRTFGATWTGSHRLRS